MKCLGRWAAGGHEREHDQGASQPFESSHGAMFVHAAPSRHASAWMCCAATISSRSSGPRST